MKRKQSRQTPGRKSDHVAGALRCIAELQDAAYSAESRTQGQSGEICGADGALPSREQNALQLHDLRLLVVDFIHYHVNVERRKSPGPDLEPLRVPRTIATLPWRR
jgi:hypothetical protein